MKRRGRKARCAYCGSSHTISKGSRKTVTLGKRALRVCKDCKRKFTVGRRIAIDGKAVAESADVAETVGR